MEDSSAALGFGMTKRERRIVVACRVQRHRPAGQLNVNESLVPT